MKNSFYLSIFFLIIACTSCKKDFLNRDPQTAIAPGQFFKTEQDLSLYINGMLAIPGTDSYISSGEQGSDNCATTGNVEIKTVLEGTPTDQTITSGWGYGDWAGLRNANYFLDNCNGAAVSQTVKNHYIGLAKYYRAIFYFEKVKRYSDVPWFGQALGSTDTALFRARDPRSLIMDSIVADLDFASANVRVDVPKGTPNVWAVKLMYARIMLYEGTYRKYHPELGLQNTANNFLQKAHDVAADIMTAGFTIYNTGNPASDYATLFSSQDLSSNNEVILANIYDVNLKKDGGLNGYLFGDYEQCPSANLVQSYLMDNGTRFTDIPGYQTYSFVQEFKNRDPRMKQTLVYPGWIPEPTTTAYIQKLNKNFTGYHQLKGYINSTDNTVIGSVDYPAYRYAEALLIYAESLAELGLLTQGDLDKSINLLRQRAGMPSLLLDAANANSDPVMGANFPDVSGTNKGVILEIRRERRVEFAFENFRFDDVMRWHAGSLLIAQPEGMYFPKLGKYDLTGDGVEDIILIDAATDIPATKEVNGLGVTLEYYKAGNFGDDVTVYLKNGNNGGRIVTSQTVRTFTDPKFYTRPIPQQQMLLNPNLKQIFGW
jgi:hypothetical protein